MKNWLSLELLFALCLLVACGDDEPSSPIIDEPETTSSSSSEKEKSSSSIDDGCDVKPYYREGWPTLLDHVSSLKNFYAYGSDMGCLFDMEKVEATLYRYKNVSADSNAWEKVGSAPIKTILLSDTNDTKRWETSWKYTTDLSSLDSPALPDGEYKVAWGEGFNVTFYLERTFPEMEWYVNVKNKVAHVNYDKESRVDFFL